MEESSAKNVLSGYASYLAEQNLLAKSAALDALKQASVEKKSYIDFLVRNKMLEESQVARTTAQFFGLPLFDINAFNKDLIPSEYLNIQLVKKKLALPLFKQSGMLYLGVADPTHEHLYEIRFLTGLETRLLVVETSKLEKVIDEIQNSLLLSEISKDSEDPGVSIQVNAYTEETSDLALYDVESAPVVNYVNKVLLDAINNNASDIHFEHYENTYRIRFRQHGLLYPIPSPPLKLANYILARIKVMSELDITEHRLPQDGRFKLTISRHKSVDFRVSVCPTVFGEKIVLRILDTTQTLTDLEKLGMHKDQEAHLVSGLQRSQGLILVTGPTGSGKTVTLYSSLHYLNVPEKNISTVEDPVEIPVQGINQVHVNLKTGFNFAVALRSFLRQDPDVIMVGEIRDLETAEIAVKAAQTGHLVLSTLHTNSAPETLTRLMNMGIEPYNLASSLTVVVAQRLLRVLCELCKIPETLPEDVLLSEGFIKEELSDIKLYTAKGCDHCIHGYKKRVGIFEVLPITKEMANLIMEGGNAIEITNQAEKEGVMNLRRSGLNKVKQGITSLAELNRVFR